MFPSAALKVYLTARPEVRAARRAGQASTEPEAVSESLARRDHQDSVRLASPMVRAADAIEIDTSFLGVEEVVEQILDLCMERGVVPV